MGQAENEEGCKKPERKGAIIPNTDVYPLIAHIHYIKRCCVDWGGTRMYIYEGKYSSIPKVSCLLDFALISKWFDLLIWLLCCVWSLW